MKKIMLLKPKAIWHGSNGVLRWKFNIKSKHYILRIALEKKQYPLPRYSMAWIVEARKAPWCSCSSNISLNSQRRPRGLDFTQLTNAIFRIVVSVDSLKTCKKFDTPGRCLRKTIAVTVTSDTMAFRTDRTLLNSVTGIDSLEVQRKISGLRASGRMSRTRCQGGERTSSESGLKEWCQGLPIFLSILLSHFGIVEQQAAAIPAPVIIRVNPSPARWSPKLLHITILHDCPDTCSVSSNLVMCTTLGILVRNGLKPVTNCALNEFLPSLWWETVIFGSGIAVQSRDRHSSVFEEMAHVHLHPTYGTLFSENMLEKPINQFPSSCKMDDIRLDHIMIYILLYSPMSQYSKQFTLHYVSNTVSIGC